MRLTPAQIDTIKSTAKAVQSEGAQVTAFIADYMQLADDRNPQSGKQACATDLLPRLRRLRGRLPDDFHFNRLEANADLPNGVLDDVNSEPPNFEKL